MHELLNKITDSAYSLLRKAAPTSPSVGMAQIKTLTVTSEEPEIADAPTSTREHAVVPAVVMQVMDRYPNVDPNLISKLVEDIWAFGHVAADDNDGKVLSVDFDGTIAEHCKFPAIGRPIPGAIEALDKLTKEGWKIVIFSHRASQLGGREQIAEWCETAGLRVGAIIPKIYARWYIDNSAIEFRDNWEAICEKLHYEVPVEVSGTAVTASAILAGDCTLKAIAAGLGFDHSQLTADIAKAYGEHTENSATIVTNMFREKYGMLISVYELAAAKDTTAYWMERFAKVANKVSANFIEEGDPVLITEQGANFGETGIVMSLTDASAEIALNSSQNVTVSVSTPAKCLKLVSGKDRARTQMTATSRVVSANKYYPSGLTSAAVSAWYAKMLPSVANYCAGHKVSAVYSYDNQSCIKTEATAFTQDTINPSKLLSLNIVLPERTTMAAIAFRPTSGFPIAATQEAVLDAVDYLSHPDLADVRVRFGGLDNYFLIMEFTKPQPRASIKAFIANGVAAFLQDTGPSNITTELTAEPNKLIIDTNVSEIPVPYSLNPESGLACLPLGIMEMARFNPEAAAIADGTSL